MKSFLRLEISVAVKTEWKEFHLIYKAVNDWAPEVELRWFVCIVVRKVGKRTLLSIEPLSV